MQLDHGTFLKDRALWTQGGLDEETNRFTSNTPNAWRLKTPLYMPSMTKIIFTVPEGVMLRAVLCQKKDSDATGDVNQDYTFDIPSSKWHLKNREAYAGNTENHVMFVVTYEDGRIFDFDEMPVRFYSPEKDFIPDYWVEKLDTVSEKITARRAQIESPVELFYLTDTHWVESAQRSPAILNHLSDKLGIKHVVFGGDMIVRHNKNKDCAIREVSGFFDWLSDDLKVFTTLGNHDRNYSSGNRDLTLRFSEPESYQIYRMDKADATFAVYEGDPSHGYFDYPEQKVRMVQFYLSDSMFGMPEDFYVDGALDWVEEKIRELDKDWTVVLFTHALWRDFHAPDNCILTDKNKQIINRILRIKRESAATLALWITGHIHKDCYDVLSDGQTELQIISTTSDGYAYSFAPNGLRMRPGTDREQCIDCMQMDVKNRTIHFTRIGAGEDRVYQY